MSNEDRKHWDRRYRSGQAPTRPAPRPWLVDQAALVDDLAAAVTAAGRRPRALDVACGAGGVVLWLAGRGWQVTGVDVSEEALALARAAARRSNLAHRCHFLATDLDYWRPGPRQFDLVTVFFFLDRVLWPSLRESLRPGGLLILQTFNRHWLQRKPEMNPAYLLEPGELLDVVTDWGWTVLAHCSLGAASERPTDALVARRPAATTA